MEHAARTEAIFSSDPDVVLLAGCIVTNRDDEILLLHRNTPHRSQWETPGGKIRGSEPVAAAARRRAEEEIGVVLSLSRIVGSCQFTSDNIRYNYLWFQAQIVSGNVAIVSPRRHDDWRYFSWAALGGIRERLSGNVRNLCRQQEQGKIQLEGWRDVEGSPGVLNSALAVPVVAGCVIQDDSGRVLVLHRIRSDRDQWEIPGGKVELGESPEQCARREVQEELGIIVEVGRCIGMKEIDHFGKQILYVWFHATIVDGGTPRVMETSLHDSLSYKSWSELENPEAGCASASVQALLSVRREATSA